LLSQTRSAAQRGRPLDSLEARTPTEPGAPAGEIPTPRPA
jgi:hypothetical protein